MKLSDINIRIFDKQTLLVSNSNFQWLIERAYDYAPIGEVTEILAYCAMRSKYRQWVVMRKHS